MNTLYFMAWGAPAGPITSCLFRIHKTISNVLSLLYQQNRLLSSTPYYLLEIPFPISRIRRSDYRLPTFQSSFRLKNKMLIFLLFLNPLQHGSTDLHFTDLEMSSTLMLVVSRHHKMPRL